MWVKLLVISLVLGLAGVIWLGLKQHRLLKRKTKDALGEELKREIKREREEYYRSQERFEKALMHQKDQNKHPFSEINKS